MGEQDFSALLKGYLEESLSPADLELFMKLAGRPENILLLQQSFEKDLENDPPDLTSPGQAENAWSKLNRKLDVESHNKIPRRSLYWVAASVCLICVLGGVYFYSTKKAPVVAGITKQFKAPSWLKPEHTGATLYMADGDSIKLDAKAKGVIASRDGVQIFQSEGVLSYSGVGEKGKYNEIKTGRGNLFRTILPDQTVVWLNSHSSIKYPLHFDADSRMVEITGEVYFEVVHQANAPFRVKAGKQLLEDIGTSFNVLSGDAGQITTLVEGSVRVEFEGKTETLVPGEQSITSKDKNQMIVEKNVNLDQVLAWKNGFFFFQKAGLRDVMKQLADWYQVDVLYKGSEITALFSGQIDKSLPVEQVIQGLQQPHVQFTFDNNKQQIIVVQK